MLKFLIILLIFILSGFTTSYGQVQDSSSHKRTSIITEGSVSVGIEYGLLPFALNPTPPQYNIKSEGNIGLSLIKLPLRISYYYSSLGIISGLNNSFTVQFDTQKFKQDQREKLQKKSFNQQKELDALSMRKQTLKAKLDYLYLLKDNKITPPPIDSSRLQSITSIDTMTINLPSQNQFLDSITFPDSTLLTNQQEVDSVLPTLPKVRSYNLQQDSLDKKIKTLQNTLTTVQTQMDQLNQLKRLQSDDVNTFQKPSFTQAVLSSIKTFEIGTTHPSYSEFLISRTPVRGINAEFQYKGTFFAFTYGTPVNNIFFNSLNNMNASQQLFNIIQIKNVNSGRKIVALKYGKGLKKGSHLYMGMLYGYGKESYQEGYISSSTERNLVGELDAQFKLKTKHTFSVIYGRSALQANDVNFNQEAHLFNKLISFNERTNAVLTRYQFKTGKTKFKITARLIDPFYQSYGVQFIRKDNIRYEVKLQQKLSKKISVGGFFRRESDNLLGINQHKNVILSYGINATYRPNRRWTFKSDYRPIIQQSTVIITDSTVANNNFIINNIAIYNTRIKHVSLQVTSVFSYYYLTNNQSSNVFTNLNMDFSIQYKSNFRNDLIYNQFNASDTSIAGSSFIIENDMSFLFKRITITGLGKFSSSGNNSIDWGYGLKLSLKVMHKFTIEGTGEKLVIGDFYSSLLQQDANNFPYYFSISLKFNF